VTGAPVVAWVDAINGGTPDPCAIGIGLERDGRLIAGVKYDAWNGASICGHVAASSAHWLDCGFLFAAFDYPFNQLHVRKIIGLVDAANARARAFDEHLGFQLEATIHGAAPGGDLLIYTMTREQCRFLDLKDRHGK